MKVKASDILELLLTKHSEDICVPECKIGSSRHMKHCRRFDLWTMRRSYKHPAYIGYEIKVNRQDFLNDEKWIEYLQYCTQFYFVCQPGVIDKSEVPEDAGLMVTSKNIKRLYTKKKAPFRNIDIPNSIFKYVLMSRTKIVNEYNEDKTGYWKQWLKEKDEKKELGYNVSQKINKILEEKIYNVEIENKKVEAENKNLRYIKEILENMGILENGKYVGTHARWNLKKLLKESGIGVPEDFVYNINRTLDSLKNIKEVVEKKLSSSSS